MFNPVVSIVMTTYNAEKYLTKQLDSLVSQTYKYINILIIDDCSYDMTMNILRDYQSKYDFINIIQNNTRLGVVKNFEKGISLVNGDLIALCDHDDIWMLDKITIQVESIKSYKTPALVHSDLEIIDQHDHIICKSFFKFKNYYFPKEKSLDILISRNGVMGNTILFNNALKNIILPFYDNIPMHDYYISTINEIYGHRITISKPLVKYRLHTTNIGNKNKTFITKIKGFFYTMPYTDKKSFLSTITVSNISTYDRDTINKFIECISYNDFRYFIKCVFFKRYFKNNIGYKIRLILRYLIHTTYQI